MNIFNLYMFGLWTKQDILGRHFLFFFFFTDDTTNRFIKEKKISRLIENESKNCRVAVPYCLFPGT